MGYDKGKMSGGGKFMNNARGMCSYKDGTMAAAKRVKPECGPGMNPDQKKANRLLQEAQKKVDHFADKAGCNHELQPILETPELLVNPAFIDEKELLKSYLNKAVETIVMQNQNRAEPYFIVFHEKSDATDSRMKISVSKTLPGYVTNQIVFWVCNRRGICEWLWTVPPKLPGQKLRVEFNTEGVAYLQAKGAMPK